MMFVMNLLGFKVLLYANFHGINTESIVVHFNFSF